MIAVSQLAASAITRHLNTNTLGINPFSAPRLDEQQAMALDQERLLVQYATAKEEARSDHNIPAEVIDHEGYAFGLEQFQLHASLPWFGLWAVANQWKDISDLASIKEQHSYAVLDRPYKFLQATDRKSVDKDTRGATAAVRKQFAVLLDFNDGRLYIENGNKQILHRVKEVLRELGAIWLPLAGITAARIGRLKSLSGCMKAATISVIFRHAPMRPQGSGPKK